MCARVDVIQHANACASARAQVSVRTTHLIFVDLRGSACVVTSVCVCARMCACTDLFVYIDDDLEIEVVLC